MFGRGENWGVGAALPFVAVVAFQEEHAGTGAAAVGVPVDWALEGVEDVAAWYDANAAAAKVGPLIVRDGLK